MARKKQKKASKPRQPRCAFYVVDASGKVHGRGASSERTLAARAKRVGRKHEGVRVVQLCSGDRRRALRQGRVPDGFSGLGSSHTPRAYPVAGTREELSGTRKKRPASDIGPLRPERLYRVETWHATAEDWDLEDTYSGREAWARVERAKRDGQRVRIVDEEAGTVEYLGAIAKLRGTREEHAAHALDQVHQAKKWADQHRNIDALAFATRANAEAAWAERPDLMEYSSLIGDAMEQRLRAGEVTGLGALPAHGLRSGRTPTREEIDDFWAKAPRVARATAAKASREAQERMFARRGAVPSVIPESRPRVVDDIDPDEAHYRRARHL